MIQYNIALSILIWKVHTVKQQLLSAAAVDEKIENQKLKNAKNKNTLTKTSLLTIKTGKMVGHVLINHCCVKLIQSFSTAYITVQ